MKSWIKYTALILVLSILCLIGFNVNKINRLTTAMNLFEPGKMSKKFKALHTIFPSERIPSSQNPYVFAESPQKMNFSFSYDNKSYTFEEFNKFSNTSGIIILKNDTILFEKYYNDLKPDDLHISWSVSKSMISALVGCALQDGLISSIQDSIGQYVTSLRASEYGHVSIENVLHMASGIQFNEDYNDFNSDINKVGRIFALGNSFEEYIQQMKSSRKAGEYNNYVSMDTQVLGMLINSVTNGKWKEYFYEKIWNPIGSKSSSKWITDDNGMFAAFGGFNATLRDYAHFGYMYTSFGKVRGQSVIDSSWIKDSWTMNKSFLLPGIQEGSSNPFGYGYQWWIPSDPAKFYVAIGVYGQYIICDPINNITIVKLSANERFKEHKRETHKEHFAFFESIINQILK